MLLVVCHIWYSMCMWDSCKGIKQDVNWYDRFNQHGRYQ